MQTKDYYQLSKTLATQMKLHCNNGITFIIGSIIPDINPFLYISWAGDKPLVGHSYSQRQTDMEKALSRCCTHSLYRWFRAGKMIHYLADFFTRPHNETFGYSYKQWLDELTSPLYNRVRVSMEVICMKTIGVMGGLSWHSSLQMYEYINEYIAKALGEYNCAKMVLVNVNLQEVFVTRKDEQEQVLLAAAKQMEAAGCDYYVICSNTMHKYAGFLSKHIKMPLLHIADATADEILSKGIKRIGLMGTRSTMEEDFYKERLIAKGLEVFIPDETDRIFIDKVLYEETGLGIVKEESANEFYAIGSRLMEKGAEGVILGCTEIGMLMHQEKTKIPLFDTTMIHGETAAKQAIEDEMR